MSSPEKYNVLNSTGSRWGRHCKGGSWWYEFSNISGKGMLILRFISIKSSVGKMPTKTKQMIAWSIETMTFTDRIKKLLMTCRATLETHLKAQTSFTSLSQWLTRKQTNWQLNSWGPDRKKNVNGHLLNNRRNMKRLYTSPKGTEVMET